MQVVSRGTNDQAVEEFGGLFGVVAQLFHVEQSLALAQVLSVSRQEGQGIGNFSLETRSRPDQS